MANFVYNAGVLPYPKADKIPLPIGEDPTKNVVATDWNTVCQALVDTRTAILTPSGAQGGAFNSQSGTTYTTVATDYIVHMTSSSARTVTLVSTAGLFKGQIQIIKDANGNAGTNNITVNTSGGQTIDGAASKTINSNYGDLRLYTDGTNWFTY